MVGRLGATGIFQEDGDLIAQGAGLVWPFKSARLLRKSLMLQIGQTEIDHVPHSFCETNCSGKDSEVNRSWAEGSLSMDEIIQRNGHPRVPCRRVGVEQGAGKEGKPKIRPTDDFSKYFHNLYNLPWQSRSQRSRCNRRFRQALGEVHPSSKTRQEL